MIANNKDKSNGSMHQIFMDKVTARFSFDAISDPYIFVNEKSTREVTTKSTNKFKSEGFDEIRLFTEHVEILDNINLTSSHMLFVHEYDTSQGSDVKQPSGFDKDSRDVMNTDEGSFSCMSIFICYSCLKMCFCLAER